MNKKDHILNGILLAIGLGFVLHPAGDVQAIVTIVQVFVPIVLGTMLPDIDTAFGHHRKTLHNVFVIAVLYGYPFYFGNLQWVWAGAISHFVLDLFGTTRGLALLYPFWDREFDIPVGVPVNSNLATLVTIVITGFEIAALAAILYLVPSLLAGNGVDIHSVARSVSAANWI